MNGICYFEEETRHLIGVLRRLGKKGQDGGERKGKRIRRRGEAFLWSMGEGKV
jgi:hypothetical protein